jgi:ribosomal protein S18 acetylase RimI-like enzyme
MPLEFRTVLQDELCRFEPMIIDSFEPVTWARRVDEVFGPLNGMDWRARWRARVARIFESQILLAGETGGEPVAFASGAYDPEARLGYIDLLAVDSAHQGKGYGREMLRGMLRHLKDRGALHANLDCLTDNDVGNALYRSEGFTEVARHIRWFIKI